MSDTIERSARRATEADIGQTLLKQYGCGPVRFSGAADALYDRHLLFDDVVAPLAAGPRERFEAAARSVRDVLAQRWVLTESTYGQVNPKRIYYLYLNADQNLCKLYADADGWARKAILNIAGSGKFSSDRTIAEYAAAIWDAKPCPVG
jgi:glucan phosphorylase